MATADQTKVNKFPFPADFFRKKEHLKSVSTFADDEHVLDLDDFGLKGPVQRKKSRSAKLWVRVKETPLVFHPQEGLRSELQT